MSRLKTRKITIPKEHEKNAIEDIITYFENERNETLGNMDAMLLFSFIMEKIAPQIYNQAVLDTQKYMSEKIQDLYELMFE
jgi:uncharacterized protein (DUF2164 family)